MRKATVGATVTLAAIAGAWNLTAVSVLGQAKPLECAGACHHRLRRRGAEDALRDAQDAVGRSGSPGRLVY